MKMRSRRGAVDPVSLVVIGLVAILAVPNWRPWNWGKKAPPTAELVAAQKDAAQAKATAAALQARVDAIAVQNEVKKQEQLTYTHQQLIGAIESNAKAPDSLERAITDAFLQRADIGFNAAVGKLDPALREEVIGIVAQLRSGDQAKIAAANAMLAEKDKELNEATVARVKLEADAVIVKAQRDKAQAEAAKKSANETKLTAQVVSYANKSYEKEKEAGSLGATVEKLFWILGFCVGGYILIHFFLPLWAQSYPNIGWLQKVAAFGKNITTAHV